MTPEKGVENAKELAKGSSDNVLAQLTDSQYLKTIAAVILVSVIVSTLFDFELKTAAKASYLSKSALAVFFSSYYGWLSVATFFFQVLLTGKTLNKLGLGSSLYVTPVTLLSGALAIMIWPGLIAAALARIADAALRNSIHRGSMEIIYMAVPAGVLKSIKTFLDVVVERAGDASAGFIIVLVGFASLGRYRPYVHFICIGLICLWIALIRILRSGYAETLRQGVLRQKPSLPRVSDATAHAKNSSVD
jgi:AAA family ATP:ADP antiporter